MKRCAAVPYEGQEAYLFISYSHRDTERVNPILERLEREGYRLWYDEGIDPGSEWPETIARHLGGACACVGLLSGNYLASDNCRREMNYALKKQIPFLSILLEPVEMSAGVEMQLSVNQAIFRYTLPSEDLFIQKIHSTAILQPARRLSEPVYTAPAPETLPVPPAAPVRQAPAGPSSAPAQDGKGGKKPRISLILLAAAVLLVSAVLLVVGLSSLKNKPSSPETEPAVPNGSVSKSRLLVDSPDSDRVLWGLKISEDYGDGQAFIKSSAFRDVAVDGGMLNLSVLPYGIEVRADDHPEILRLYYLDRVGSSFILQGQFSVKDGILTVSPCEKVSEDARPLAQTLTYTVELHYDSLFIRENTAGKSMYYTAADAALSGAADGKTFRDVAAVGIREIEEGAACTLRFTDGEATDAVIDAFYNNIKSISLKWTKERRLYNGSMADFDVTGRCNFYYLNTSPYGFLLIDGNVVYFYQQPFSADSD